MASTNEPPKPNRRDNRSDWKDSRGTIHPAKVPGENRIDRIYPVRHGLSRIKV